MSYIVKKVMSFNKDSKIVLFVIKGSNQLVRSGMVENKDEFGFCLWGNAMVAYSRNGKVVGVMTYQKQNEGLWINLSFVDKSYRRRGIYRAMYSMLKETCIKDKKKFIESSTHIKNKAMQACAKKTGRAASYVTLKWKNDV